MKMNYSMYVIVMVLSVFAFFSCQNKSVDQFLNTLDNNEKVYDSIKAAEYGADDYGMKKFVMAFLRRGSNRDLDQDSANKLQMAHLENITRMANEGKLVLAGPFIGNQDLRGIYIFNVSTVEEAQQLTNTDPAIKAGVLEMELMEWYGSAALIDVNQIHNTLAKKGISD